MLSCTAKWASLARPRNSSSMMTREKHWRCDFEVDDCRKRCGHNSRHSFDAQQHEERHFGKHIATARRDFADARRTGANRSLDYLTKKLTFAGSLYQYWRAAAFHAFLMSSLVGALAEHFTPQVSPAPLIAWLRRAWAPSHYSFEYDFDII